MTNKYFSDEELGSKELSSEEISVTVWNSIVAIYQQFISNGALAGNFADECPEGRVVCGCSKYQLENALKGEIPDLPIPVVQARIYEQSYNDFDFLDDEDNDQSHVQKPNRVDGLPNKYAILDFLQFLYENIIDPIEFGYHDYHRHYHYSFSDDGVFKSQFRERINRIFNRNGIVFFLDEDGQIKRSIPKSIAKIITDIRFNTGDERLNELLEIAYSKFVLPRSESRIESLEKIWDAFERMKTYFEENKRLSAPKLIDIVSEDNTLFSEYLNSEFAQLTKIGNEFQIRHFERDKVKLESNLHIDYLFYRMSSLIHLCVEKLKSE
jgi:hypothetical protein